MEWIALLNIIAPHAFKFVADLRKDHPEMTYEESLRAAGVTLDAQYVRLLANMAKAVEEGAVPRR